VGTDQTGARRQIRALYRRSREVCTASFYVSPAGTPNFKILYSHVSTFPNPSGYMILGQNPGGTRSAADEDDIEIAMRNRNAGWSAYLDEVWEGQSKKGMAKLQKAVLAVFQTLEGNQAAETKIRESAAANIIPFRSKSFDCVPDDLLEPGRLIGWELIQLAAPRVLVMLANGSDPWGYVIGRCGIDEATFRSEPVGNRFYYKQGVLQGPLNGTLAIGLPAVNRLGLWNSVRLKLSENRSDIVEHAQR
jgi:hypothetical protein